MFNLLDDVNVDLWDDEAGEACRVVPQFINLFLLLFLNFVEDCDAGIQL